MFYTTYMLGKGAKNALSVLLYKNPHPTPSQTCTWEFQCKYKMQPVNSILNYFIANTIQCLHLKRKAETFKDGCAGPNVICSQFALLSPNPAN